jgi:hypothetical protein
METFFRYYSHMPDAPSLNFVLSFNLFSSPIIKINPIMGMKIYIELQVALLAAKSLHATGSILATESLQATINERRVIPCHDIPAKEAPPPRLMQSCRVGAFYRPELNY